ncbi:unnamed protein product [Ostreobium quekettii]|uniref:Uncharacterized protein n=1 Tax=Ostreobium quekettii TaxID=121088 RepID=A0A8S1J8D7_9CHLO|nr:unnamed protein product [Ostreobium quekettii]
MMGSVRCPATCAAAGVRMQAGADADPGVSRVGGRTKYSVRVCINKTCKGQGSPGVLQFAQDLCHPDLDVNSCGCLGNCGNGPNMVILPAEREVSHVGTPARMAEVLNMECGIQVSSDLVEATQCRQSGNVLARSGKLKEAMDKYSEGIALGVSSTLHLLYSNRSGVRLTLGDHEGAQADALLAVEHAPVGFTTAHIRLIDAYYIQGQYEQSAQVLQNLVDTNPEFRATKEFSLISKQLEKDLKVVAR